MDFELIVKSLPRLFEGVILTVELTLISVIQLPELLRNADIAARAVRRPLTFYFAASLMYLAITIVSMLGQQRLEAWAGRGIRRD